MRVSTHRAVQLHQLADTARAESAVCVRAALAALEINNRTMARRFLRRSERLNVIGIRASQKARA